MFTLLGSLLGFVSSVVPSILKLFTDKADKAHELAIMDKQLEMQRAGAVQRLEEINVQADIAESQALYKSVVPSGVPWVDALSGTVRPVITYAFFALFMGVKGYGLLAIMDNGVDVGTALMLIWDVETAALFAAIMSFWFGGRALHKMRGK
ncbi:hypothetical protein UFOVP1299_36 [uncultured Caudovirales phage]|uniref:Holin of 3TMs, for gene-transfer release n=1 Tax=uncultured Caudovirales phage TaxID=2100421 RepID=A0A6J5RNQ7_9CAUD|nr:hypothetical protein UFOVP1299_36 [uncultured Caudovirales phage]